MKIPAPRPLRQLYRRRTSYEIIARLPDGRIIRLGFLSRVNKVTLLELAREWAEVLLPYIPEETPGVYTASHGWQLGGVRIGKSGRTEYDIASEERSGECHGSDD